MTDITQADLDKLAEWDTPTICNGLEALDQSFRLAGYSTKAFTCMRPEQKPMVGYARTATIRASNAPAMGPEKAMELRQSYYEYVDTGGPKPSVTVIQDLDTGPARGAFWGEVNTNIHKGLGSLGVITNGSIRDLADSAAGFQALAGQVGPSHAWVHVTGFGEPIEEYRNSKLVDWQTELKRHLKKKTKTDTSTTELGLEKKPGTEKKRYLIAHSLGGALAINTLLNDAQQNELQVDGLVLLAPAIEVSNIRSPIFPTRFWHELTGWTMFFTTVMESPFPADTVDPAQQEYPERIRFTPRSVVSDTFKLIDLNRGRGGELKIPTMVVIAAKDQVNDNAAMESFYDSLTCEKKLLTLDNSGHNMQVDYQWEELSDEILKFFDSLED